MSMVWFLLVLLLHIGYCAMYLVHSIGKKRASQAASVAVLTLLQLAAGALLAIGYLF